MRRRYDFTRPSSSGYFRVADAACLLFVVAAIGGLIETSSRSLGGTLGLVAAVAGLGWWICTAALIFGARRQDEFVRGCYRQAASATIRMLLVLPPILLLFGGFIGGVIDGAAGAPHGRSAWISDMTARDLMIGIWMVLFASFLFFFQAARFRGLPE